MKKRHVGQVSFTLSNTYEQKLMEFALRPEHGPFSQYVKRLIERDRSGQLSVQGNPNNPMIELSKADKEAALDFL